MGTTTSSQAVANAPKEREGGPKPPEEQRRHHQACLACGSERTECIHFEGGGSLIGWFYEAEYLCRDCGKYSLYEEAYDS